jgi:hypothetical protein
MTHKVTTINAYINSVDQAAIDKYVREWRYKHGEPRACHAQWEVCQDNVVRWFPAKLFRLEYADTYGELRLDCETGEVTVTKHPNDKQERPTTSLDPLDLDRKPDTPTYGLTPMERAA